MYFGSIVSISYSETCFGLLWLPELNLFPLFKLLELMKLIEGLRVLFIGAREFFLF
jgi:hypothetical protein